MDDVITSQIEGLTARQREILRLIARHKRGKEIARELNITERTVKAHTVEARKRLNVASSRDAALLLLDYETQNGTVPEGQWRPRTVSLAQDFVPFSEHEHRHTIAAEPSTSAGGLHDLPMERTSGSMGIHVAAEPARGREGHDRGDPGGISQPLGPSGSDPAPVRYVLVNGFAEFGARLKALSLPGWIGLILVLAVLSAVIVGGLLYLSLGVLEAMEHIFRRAS